MSFNNNHIGDPGKAINRNNYEEYFLLYVDNELSRDERKAVESFVRENPDLEKELLLLEQSVVYPDKKLIFDNKQLLFKSPIVPNPVNESNYEEYFVMYSDDELSNDQKDLVEQFVYKHPQYQEEFELIQQVKFMPDAFVSFPDKSVLYRKEEREKVIVMSWWRIAAAAVVLLILGAVTWNSLFKKPASVQPGPESIAKVKTDTNADNQNATNNPDKNSISNPSVTAPVVTASVNEKSNNKKQDRKNPNKQSTIFREEQPIVKNLLEKGKVENSSNFPNSTIVTHPIDETVKIGDPNKERNIKMALATIEERAGTKKDIIDKQVDFEKLSKNDKPLESYASNDDDRNNIEILNTSISKKNSMRGFFRKVSRVVSKATNIGPNENDNSKGLRIANFEIALK